jgi:pimeloyl-ACP methyl ester carboxylesterase
MVGPAAKHAAVAHLQDTMGLSERRACSIDPERNSRCSQNPPAPMSRSYCLEGFVEDVARVFRELSIEKAVLIGLSMGGIVAQKFALKYGHLLKALVLVDTTAHGIGPDATDDAFLGAADKQGCIRRKSHRCPLRL